MSDSNLIRETLSNDSVFSKFSRQEITRLIPYVEMMNVHAGSLLFDEQTDPHFLYLINKGAISLGSEDKPVYELTEGYFGEESIVDAAHYGVKATAKEDSVVFRIPANALHIIVKDMGKLKSDFFFSLLNKNRVHRLEPREANISEKKRTRNLINAIGWLLTICTPLIVFNLLQSVELFDETRIFVSVLSATFLMWAFRLTSEFVPGIFAVLTALVLGLAPVKTSLSGFTSSSFILALSVFSLGSIIISSGLTYRLLLFILRWVPAKQITFNLSALLTGYFLTPMVPTITGRCALIAPFAGDLVRSCKLAAHSIGATRLAVSSFVGVTLFAPVFLSASPVNFLVLSLLPLQDQLQFHWLGWLNASLIYAGVSTVLYLIASTIYFWKAEPVHVSLPQVKSQIKAIGPLTATEWVAFSGFMFFILGILTFEVHKIPIAWIGLVVLFILMAFGVVGDKDFKSKIDWPTLMVLVGVVGVANIMSHLGIHDWFSRNLTWLSVYIQTDLYMFFVLLLGFLILMRLFIHTIIANVIAITVFMPLASVSGVNPWIVAFAILALGDIWFFPYQCFHYGPYRALNQEAPFYNEKHLVRFNWIVNIIKIIALFACISYWESIWLI